MDSLGKVRKREFIPNRGFYIELVRNAWRFASDDPHGYPARGRASYNQPLVLIHDETP